MLRLANMSQSDWFTVSAVTVILCRPVFVLQNFYIFLFFIGERAILLRNSCAAYFVEWLVLFPVRVTFVYVTWWFDGEQFVIIFARIGQLKVDSLWQEKLRRMISFWLGKLVRIFPCSKDFVWKGHCIWFCLCVWFLLVVNTSASDCLERLVPEVTFYVSRRTLNSTHSHSVYFCWTCAVIEAHVNTLFSFSSGCLLWLSS